MGAWPFCQERKKGGRPISAHLDPQVLSQSFFFFSLTALCCSVSSHETLPSFMAPSLSSLSINCPSLFSLHLPFHPILCSSPAFSVHPALCMCVGERRADIKGRHEGRQSQTTVMEETDEGVLAVTDRG